MNSWLGFSLTDVCVRCPSAKMSQRRNAVKLREAPSVHAQSVTLETRRNLLCHTVFLLPHWSSCVSAKVTGVSFQATAWVSVLPLNTHRNEKSSFFTVHFRKLVHHHKVQERNRVKNDTDYAQVSDHTHSQRLAPPYDHLLSSFVSLYLTGVEPSKVQFLYH